jgi:hypothetical protein
MIALAFLATVALTGGAEFAQSGGFGNTIAELLAELLDLGKDFPVDSVGNLIDYLFGSLF